MNRLEAKLEKIGSDGKVTAKAVGLRYTLASSKGYHRIKKGKDFYRVGLLHRLYLVYKKDQFCKAGLFLFYQFLLFIIGKIILSLSVIN